jgi:hypothetical protein
VLSKNLIPANNFRRLSFESRHNLDVDKQTKHVETIATLKRRSMKRRSGGIRQSSTVGQKSVEFSSSFLSDTSA